MCKTRITAKEQEQITECQDITDPKAWYAFANSLLPSLVIVADIPSPLATSALSGPFIDNLLTILRASHEDLENNHNLLNYGYL